LVDLHAEVRVFRVTSIGLVSDPDVLSFVKL